MNKYLELWDNSEDYKRMDMFDSATETDSKKLPEHLFSLNSDDLNKSQQARLIGIIRRSLNEML